MIKKCGNLSWLSVSILVIIIDRLSKVLAVVHLQLGQPLAIFPGFNLTLSYNAGAAFSFLSNGDGWQRWFFAVIAVVVSLVIIIWLWRTSRRSAWFAIALALVLGGAVGNCWDRILHGFVVDYFDFYFQQWHFAIFNVADCAISVGAFMLIVDSLRSEKKLTVNHL